MEHRVVVADRSAALTAQPAIFECECGTVENALDRKLPGGWDKLEYQGRTIVRCPDCNEAIEREHRAAQAAAAKPVPAALAAAGDRLDAATAGLTTLCAAAEIDEAAFERAGDEYMQALSSFMLELENATGIPIALLLRRISGHDRDAVLFTAPAAQAPSNG